MIDIRATRSPVIPAKAGIQYAAASRFYRWRSGILGRPVKPGDDGLCTCGDLPVGRFVDGVVESYFGFSEKYFCSHLTQINSRTLAVPAHRGAFRDRHKRWAWDAVDAAALGARRGLQGGFGRACERSNGELTNDVAAYGEVVWS